MHALESLFGLAGRTALVTGGSRGIGRSACLGLAQAGAAVAVHYGSDAEAAAGVVAEIEAAGGRAAAFGADLSRPELIAPLLAEVGEFAGESGLGVLVNNAGIYPPGSIESLTAEEWDRVFARERAGAVPGHAGGAAAAAPGRRRARDQRRHGDVPPRRARLAPLRRVEGRRDRPDALPGARARARRHHRQLPRAQHGGHGYGQRASAPRWPPSSPSRSFRSTSSRTISWARSSGWRRPRAASPPAKPSWPRGVGSSSDEHHGGHRHGRHVHGSRRRRRRVGALARGQGALESGQPRGRDRRLARRRRLRPGRRRLRRRRHDDRHQRRAHPPRRARRLPDDRGVPGRPAHPAHQPQAPLRLPLAQADPARAPARLPRRRRSAWTRKGACSTRSTSRRSRRRSRRSSTSGEELPAVAVCFLFSYLNPEHELAARELLAQRFPELAVSLSHEVAPIWREYERGTTVTVDAYLKPLFERYVDGVSSALEGKGTGGTWALLKSNGGHALAGEARARPAHLLLSGIAGGAIGGAYAARAAGAPEAIALDMGGTSCDVCLIVGGEPLYSSDFEIEFGLPVSVPSVSTRTIGAGGGSIGWVDPGGFLQVGPQSAGAVPGPAVLRPGRRERDDHRRRRRARPARSRRSSSAASSRSIPSARRACSTRWAASSGWTASRRPRPWCASATRTWRTRSAS